MSLLDFLKALTAKQTIVSYLFVVNDNLFRRDRSQDLNEYYTQYSEMLLYNRFVFYLI